jgi:hypothetical protein
MKILNDFPNESKEPLLKLHKSLNTNSVEEVLNCVEGALGPGICDMILRKPDKKRERYTMRLDYEEVLIGYPVAAFALGIVGIILTGHYI